MWRPRDRERFIGTYDPEHEMPDPDREPGDRWQSDAYRNNFHDSRYAYRMNPDRFEGRFGGRQDVDHEMRMRWEHDARDREREMGRYGSDRYDRGYDYDRSYGRGYDSNVGRGGGGAGGSYGGGYGGGYRGGAGGGYGGGYGREYDNRGGSGGRMTGPHFDHDRMYGGDRGWDVDRERYSTDRFVGDGRYGNERYGYDRDRYQSERSGGRERELDWGVWERDRDWRRR